jgi:hypothetical protein
MSSLAKERAAITVVAAILLLSSLLGESGYRTAEVLGVVASAAFCWWFVAWRRPADNDPRRGAADR